MLNLHTSNHWRESLVPAAAVIPAPIAYFKVVAVKTFVVVFLLRVFPFQRGHSSISVGGFRHLTVPMHKPALIILRKLECLKQAWYEYNSMGQCETGTRLAWLLARPNFQKEHLGVFVLSC